MKKLLSIGALIAAAVTLAACGGSSGTGDSATAAQGTGNGSAVSVQNIGDAGRVLVDSTGQALYASDQEAAAGKVLCTGACTSFWMPLTVSGGTPKGGPVGADLGVVKRPDGTTQVTYKGMPLYSFTQEGSGQVTGDGFKDAFNGRQFTWNVVAIGNGGGSTGAASSGPLGY